MNEANVLGPPLRVETGAVVGAPSVPGTPIAAGAISPFAARPQSAAPNAAGTFSLYRATSPGPYSPATSTIAETSAGAAGPVVFMTGNWFGAYSTNNGSTFSYANPFTQFASLDGGFCCDQTVTYDRNHDQMIWQLQYSYSPSTAQGGYLTAFAPASSVADAGWCTYAWEPSIFGLGAGLFLDYPHVALSDNFAYYTANVYDSSDLWNRTLIWRVPLSATSTCSGFSFNYLVVSDHFNFTPVQGATSRMYWASHNSTSSIRIYYWDDAGSTIFWNNVAITTWPRNLPYSCPGPDGLNWCGRGPNDGRIQTGWVAGGVLGFMWNASQGGPYPYPHVHVARFNASDRSLINEPILWYTDYAWQFPAMAVNDRGHIAGTAYVGGGPLYPSMNALIADDFSAAPAPWENYILEPSSKGSTNWGDWYSARRHGTNGNTWIATGQQRLTDGSVKPWYVWFGRERDIPWPTVTTPTSSSVATTTAILGGNVTSNGGEIGRAPWREGAGWARGRGARDKR